MRNLDVRIHAGQSTGILDGLTSVWHHCEDSDTTFLYNEGRIFKLREAEEADILAKYGTISKHFMSMSYYLIKFAS